MGEVLPRDPYAQLVFTIPKMGKFHAAESIDFAPLEEVFRQRTLQMMLQRAKITAERAELLGGWVHSGFAVNSGLP